MKVSFVILSKNHGKYLKRCLESFLDQDFKDFEIILCDLDSKDNTKNICLGFQKNNGNIKTFSYSIKKYFTLKKKILSLCNGENIIFINPYEVFENGELQSSIKDLNTNKKVYGFVKSKPNAKSNVKSFLKNYIKSNCPFVFFFLNLLKRKVSLKLKKIKKQGNEIRKKKEILRKQKAEFRKNRILEKEKIRNQKREEKNKIIEAKEKEKAENRQYLSSLKKLYDENKKNQNTLSSEAFRKGFKKYCNCLIKDKGKAIVFAQTEGYLTSNFNLISDNLVYSKDFTDPVLFVVERNELERMKIFFDHYRKLGVSQFVVLDNGSDDGTIEFLKNQKNTKVYQVLEKFQTQKKESWIEKLIELEGLNRWCIVVDSDELLDFVGSENHSVLELIKKGNELGYDRIWGYMVDMYSEKPLFFENEKIENITQSYKYFDYDSYKLDFSSDPKSKSSNDQILGGPRNRLFGLKNCLSKQAIFLYKEDYLYRNCHFIYPKIHWSDVPCWFVLRHYKFLNSDKAEYERRIQEKCFFNNSHEYEVIMNKLNETEVSMFSEKSKEYVNSDSLRCLPFIDEIPWNKKISSKTIMLQGYLHNANFGDILAGDVFYKRCKEAGFKKTDFYQYKNFGIGPFFRKHAGYGTVKDQKECFMSDAFVIISGGSFWNDAKNVNDADVRYQRFVFPAFEYLKKGKPVYILGVGGGPVDTPWLRKKMVELLNKAKVVTFRDEETKKIFESYGVKNKMTVTADTMLTITPESLAPFEEKYQLDLVAGGKKKLLLHIPDGAWENSCVYKYTVPALIKFLNEHKEYTLVLSNDNIRGMTKAEKQEIEKIKKAFTAAQISFYDYKYFDSWQMCSLINEMDCVVTSKLHVGVVSASLNKCVVSFPVHREKTDNFYKMIGESERCINVRNLDSEKAFEQICKFHDKPVHISSEMRKQAELNLSVLDDIANGLL